MSADHGHNGQDDHDDFGGLHRDLGAQVTLASDNVFRDGSSLELATITRSVASGFTAALTIAV